MAPRPERILIWGAGGHGKVVADVARAAGHQVVGFVDSDASKLGTTVDPCGGAVVALEQDLLDAAGDAAPLPCNATAVALAIGDNRRRLECAELLAGVNLPPLVHPSAVVSPSATIGRGALVAPRAVINAGAQVREAAIINTAAVVEHDCDVGAGAHVSPGVLLLGAATLGRESWVGAGAVLLPGMRIGSRAVVGAGSVVIKNVPDKVTVVGSPARVIKGQDE